MTTWYQMIGLPRYAPLLTAVNSNVLNAFAYEQNLAADESMVPYYGKHSAKQFMCNKPIHFGFNV